MTLQLWYAEGLHKKLRRYLLRPEIDSARCSLADRYDNPIPTQFLAPFKHCLPKFFVQGPYSYSSSYLLLPFLKLKLPYFLGKFQENILSD